MSGNQKQPVDDKAKEDAQAKKLEGGIRVVAWSAYIFMAVLAIVIALQDPVILRAFYAENDAHREKLDTCSRDAREGIHERMKAGEFTLYGSFIRTPGAQLRCLAIEP